MNWRDILLILEPIIAAGIVTAILLHRREMPRAMAAVSLTREEVAEKEWGRFQREIGRLEERIQRLEDENEQLRADASKQRGREAGLEQENRSLRSHVGRLEKRIAGLERIFKVHPITPEIQHELDRLSEEGGK